MIDEERMRLSIEDVVDETLDDDLPLGSLFGQLREFFGLKPREDTDGAVLGELLARLCEDPRVAVVSLMNNSQEFDDGAAMREFVSRHYAQHGPFKGYEMFVIRAADVKGSTTSVRPPYVYVSPFPDDVG
ncbi:MAG: hypothetical protein ACTHOD_03565 [Motilibacteraceae bacterium]